MGARLGGKVAIITGAAKGLGAADARLFAAEGARVVLADVDTDAGQALAEELGPAARFVQHDVTDEAAWQRLVAECERIEGRLDVLVNNAGVARLSTPETVTQDAYHTVLSVSLDGVVWGCKHALPAMRRVGGGSIVNVASIAAARGEPNHAPYSAAKGGVDAYTRTVAFYCQQIGLPVRCNAVLPAGIYTPMIVGLPDVSDRGSGLVRGIAASANPRGLPKDVAQAVLFLASDEARWISGQSLVIDRGSSAGRGTIPAEPLALG
ncbi:SDR family oxidoreductase [Microvirga sp. SRT01]|uniref:SDR family oxidoreductase n=1 Tax=Sphingomonas longa TaxID=2778730 RepID=A0ABS2DBF9_9SPHN|nr:MULTISPECIES: SDR family oxidoreductase [Alphaproteobacteria]MBM6577833.1 SDR family oxidoreductase [Sphingomonas sp. BT552]MBR7710875.1 SDR family oxidoreductase [Microvirga sp. SRT01]